MTAAHLRDQVQACAGGLDAELAILNQIHRLSVEQHGAVEAAAWDRLAAATRQRDDLMERLREIEDGIRDTRTALASRRDEISAVDGFGRLSALHRAADAIVSRILASDRATRASLDDAEASRREASATLETGESTLAAYRRVIAPADNGPSLLDRRG